jgi:hypothetical protein
MPLEALQECAAQLPTEKHRMETRTFAGLQGESIQSYIDRPEENDLSIGIFGHREGRRYLSQGKAVQR